MMTRHVSQCPLVQAPVTRASASALSWLARRPPVRAALSMHTPATDARAHERGNSPETPAGFMGSAHAGGTGRKTLACLSRAPVWPKYSCGLVVVVFQEPPEPLSTLDWPFTIIGRLPGTKRNHIAESLMTTFLVVMLNVLAQHMPQ